jgi:hypothetical protein
MMGRRVVMGWKEGCKCWGKGCSAMKKGCITRKRRLQYDEKKVELLETTGSKNAKFWKRPKNTVNILSKKDAHISDGIAYSIGNQRIIIPSSKYCSRKLYIHYGWCCRNIYNLCNYKERCKLKKL